jgi:hypothetical protein
MTERFVETKEGWPSVVAFALQPCTGRRRTTQQYLVAGSDSGRISPRPSSGFRRRVDLRVAARRNPVVRGRRVEEAFFDTLLDEWSE